MAGQDGQSVSLHQAGQAWVIAPKTPGVCAVGGQDQPVFIEQKTSAGLACDAGFWVVVAGDFARLFRVCDVAKGERAEGEFGFVITAKI